MKGLIFKPKIPTEFKGCVKLVKNKDANKTPVHMWTTKELGNLVELRGLGFTYKNIAKLTGRTQTSLVAAVDSNNLYSKIDQRRYEHASVVLNLEPYTVKKLLLDKR